MSFILRLLVVTTLAVLTIPAWAAEGSANAIFLVAPRELRDPNFEKSVVLVTYPPSGLPFGVIINRPLAERLSAVFPDQSTLKDRKEVLYFGGPVARQGLVFLVHSPGPPEGAVKLLPDVFFTSDVALIESLFQRKDPLQGMRVFAGYSGWGPGQLQSEVARGGWHVLPADAATVFDKDPKSIWPELIERVTAKQAKSKVERRKAEGNLFSPPPSLLDVAHHPSLITHHAFSAGGAHP